MGILDYFTETVIHQRFDGTLDSYGKPARVTAANWDTQTTVKGMVRPLSGVELIARGKSVADNVYIVYTENISGIREDDRLSIGSIIYNIEHIKDPNSLTHHLEIECTREI